MTIQPRTEISSSTDVEWEKWGRQDPYFAVLTNPRFRAAVFTPEARAEFFALGQRHVEHVLHVCRTHIQGDFAPRRILDFGCGVGRVLLPFARTGAAVVGVDVSTAMLEEARRNCEREGVEGVVLAHSDDTLSQVDGEFDLVHTCIVIQHIEIERGLKIFSELAGRIRRGGIGALHVTFACDQFAARIGIPPPPPPPPPPALSAWWKPRRRASALPSMSLLGSSRKDPEMQMNFYNLSQLMFILQQEGVGMVHCQLTDHGGAIGAFMFFRKGA